MSSELWYVRDRNRVTGPFNRDQLESLRRRGQLARFHQVSQDQRNWVSATTLKDIFGPSADVGLVPLSEEVAPQSAPTWFYATGTDPSGPIRVEELLGLLRGGLIHSETMVWREGLPTWIRLQDAGLGPAVSITDAPQTATPHRQSEGKSKIAAALLALFLGGIGVHKFYLGGWGWGLIYLLTFWTFIPALIAFIEFIVYLTMSDEKFDQTYNRGRVTAFTW